MRAPQGTEYIYNLMEYLLKVNAKSCFLCSCMLSVFLNLPENELWACAQTRVCSLTPFTDTLSLSGKKLSAWLVLLPRLSLKLSAVPCASQVTEISMGEFLMHSSVVWLNPHPSLGRMRKDPEMTVFGESALFIFTVSLNCHLWMFAVEKVNRYKPVLGLLHRVVCRNRILISTAVTLIYALRLQAGI